MRAYTRSGSARKRRGLPLLVFVFLLLVLLCCAAVYLRTVSTQIAVSDACDAVSAEVNAVVIALMREGDYDADYFVRFVKDEGGEVTAVSCNMARINALSAEILDRVVGATDGVTATVRIPAGSLSGVSMLMGRGPKVPVDVVALTSSRVSFDSSIVSAGINQTRHRISLVVHVDVDILVPWGTESSSVETEVLIADTVIVGRVPETYLNMEG